MPLSKLQGEILLLLAAHRDPESYVAGSTYLTRSGPRISGDIDIFHWTLIQLFHVQSASDGARCDGCRRRGVVAYPTLLRLHHLTDTTSVK